MPDHTHKKLVDVAAAREVVVHVFVLSVCVVSVVFGLLKFPQ